MFPAQSYKRARTMKVDQVSLDARNMECGATLKALNVPEILLEIFSHLNIKGKAIAAQVSWLWYDISKHPRLWNDAQVSLWYNENVPYLYKIMPTEMLIWSNIKLKCKWARASRFIPKHWNKAIFTQPRWRSFSTIRNLAVKMDTAKTINLIVQRFRNLVSLELKYQGKRGVRDIALTQIASGLKLLRHLDLEGCNHITDMGLASLCGWNGVSSDGSVPLLHSLSLRLLRNLTDNTLKFLSLGQPHLKSLNVSSCYGITNNGLAHLIRLVNLHVLNVGFCPGINDYGMVHLAQMINLNDLDLIKIPITSVGLTLLGSGDSRLTNLKLNLTTIDDECGHLLANFTHLTKLNLSRTNIGNLTLEYLANGKLPIDTLTLWSCRKLTHVAGRHLSRMKHLRVLDLHNAAIGDTGFSYLADAVDSRIKILSLVKTNYTTDASLSYLTRMTGLHNIFVCSCNFFIKWRLADPRIVLTRKPDNCHECSRRMRLER